MATITPMVMRSAQAALAAMRKIVAMAAMAAPATMPAVATAADLGPLAGPDGALGAGWRVAGLPGQKVPLTRFAAERIDGRDALRLQADVSYGNLVHDLPARPPPHRLRWSWRVERPNPSADLTVKAGDDAAAKVCLTFDLPLERVPFVERQRLRLARSRTGLALPAATLCWVWGRAEAPGSLLPNAYTRRVRFIVLRGQGNAPGRWFDEERDVEADLRRAFGDEIVAGMPLPPLVGVLVAADADNTGASTLAHVAGLRFER
jgi:hypothetical protein